ncbi:MAG: polymerase subunit sigma [Rhodospirillales bacterium]|nr:polymerase subunit sigma [Rhodospirillales bacterium]
MRDFDRSRRFDAAVLPHLERGYALARWLVRDASEAEDVVQDACIRALRYIEGWTGDGNRAWFLAIVRNAAYDRMAKRGARAEMPLDDSDLGVVDATPETALLAAADRTLLNRLVEELPPLFREVIVLREVEELAYRDIATVTGVPVGTVMSRLARARGRLLVAWRAATMSERA